MRVTIRMLLRWNRCCGVWYTLLSPVDRLFGWDKRLNSPITLISELPAQIHKAPSDGFEKCVPPRTSHGEVEDAYIP